MKAIILAAGKGERLGDITKNIPKPMIEVEGKPILAHNIEMCKQAGVKDLFINLHHLPDRITEYFQNGKKYGVNLTYLYESEIRGTAGALLPIINKLGNPFLVLYGDNYSKFRLKKLIQFHHEKDSDFTITLHWRKDTSTSGVVEINKKWKIIKFIEKPIPGEIRSNWVNAGIYIINPAIIKNMIKPNIDFASNVIPLLIEKKCRLFGFKMDKKVYAIDTPRTLNETMSQTSKVSDSVHN